MGRSPCCSKEGLKKGPWTPEEDQLLMAFVKEHGHGNWRSLPKKCGLLRCGKSCRLRWTNYLRPDIKRGLFSQSEEHKIIQLHSLVGNKWAFIASQLPKRTDNEIKNYWNTVLKKRRQKLGLLSLGTVRTHSTLTPAADHQRQGQHTIKGIKNSASIIKKPSCNNLYSDMKSNVICSSAGMSCTHLAQWETARLEAEARLSKGSLQSSKTHKPLSFNYMGHSFSNSPPPTTTTAASSAFSFSSSAFSSFPTTTASSPSSLSPNIHTTNLQSLQQLSNFLLNPSPSLLHHPPTISLSLPASMPAILSLPSTCSRSNNSSTPSKSLSSLSSQESIASALTLVPTGRLSWQTEDQLTSPPIITSTSQSSFISQMLCKIDRHHGHEVELNASTKGDVDVGDWKGMRGNEQGNLEATSPMMDLNTTYSMENSVDLNTTIDNWHELIFEVENSCSDVVSSNWKAPIIGNPQREEFTHDAATSNSTCKSGCPHVPNVEDNGSLELEGLNLINFESLMSCEHYANQNSKEVILWDSPTALSVSSTSIVN